MKIFTTNKVPLKVFLAADQMHTYPARRQTRNTKNTRYTDEENEATYWNTAAQQIIYEKITETYNTSMYKKQLTNAFKTKYFFRRCEECDLVSGRWNVHSNLGGH